MGSMSHFKKRIHFFNLRKVRCRSKISLKSNLLSKKKTDKKLYDVYLMILA